MKKPEVIYCLLCDDIRAEQHGRVSMMGFLGAPPHIRLYVNNLGKPVPRLGVLFGIINVKRELNLEITLRPPEGDPTTISQTILPLKEKQMVAMLGGLFLDLAVNVPGKWKILLTEKDNGELYGEDMFVEVAESIPAQPETT